MLSRTILSFVKNRKWKRVLKGTAEVLSKIDPPRASDKFLKV